MRLAGVRLPGRPDAVHVARLDAGDAVVVLGPGDMVEVEIDRLGTLRTPITG